VSTRHSSCPLMGPSDRTRKPGEVPPDPHVHDRCYCLDHHVWVYDTATLNDKCTRCFDQRCATVAYACQCTRGGGHPGRHVYRD